MTKETLAMFLISLLSAVLNFTNLSKEGYANSYYAAAVKSMTLNLKNFFFVSFDPSGFVTIDKPPLGYWFQAVSAKIFGFSGWSILLPQALAGVLSVIVLYHLVKRSFGSAAGLVSALFLAVTPVFVAVSRNNTVDNMLVFFLLLACWAVSVAAEKGRLKYLIAAMVLVGLGFNIKMLQAYLILPALYGTYLFSTSISLPKRILHLTAGTAVLLVVSLSWALIVDAVPANQRPYIDSSTNNTVMELITGHNGLERINIAGIIGDSKGSGRGPGGGPGFGGTNDDRQMRGRETSGNEGESTQPPAGMQGGGGQGGGMMPGGGAGRGAGGGLAGSFGGQTAAGLSRLFSKNILSDQIVWFIPLALFGFIAAALNEKFRTGLNTRRKQALALWLMWFLPEFVYFSYNTGTWHSYYLTMMAAPAAALAGIGMASMWEQYQEGGWKSWLLPSALFVSGAVHILMLSYFIDSGYLVKILMGIVALACCGSSALLGLINLRKKQEHDDDVRGESDADRGNKKNKLWKALAGLALTGILITPLVGSAAAIFSGSGGSFPAAGLELLSQAKSFYRTNTSVNNNGNNARINENNANSVLIEFLQENKTANQKYLLVVSSANDCADIIIQTGEPVMCLGGFLGNNSPLTLEEFKALAAEGEIRYVMAGNRGGRSNSEIMSWVSENGKPVSAGNDTGSRSSAQLYDLKDYTDSMGSN